MSQPIYLIRETIWKRTYPIMWAETREEAVEKMNSRIDFLVKQHEKDEEKVFINRGDDRACIFKQTLGFIYNGGLSQQQTLSIVEVPHHTNVSEDTKSITTTEVDNDFNKMVGGDPILD